MAAAALSKPSIAVSWNGTPGSNGVRSSTGPQARAGADPVDVEPAYGGQQVGAEGQVRAAAALEDGQDLGEGVGDQVVGVAGAGELARQASRGVDVPGEELAVGVDVAAPDGRDQLGVAGAVDVDSETLTNTPTGGTGTCDASMSAQTRNFPGNRHHAWPHAPSHQRRALVGGQEGGVMGFWAFREKVVPGPPSAIRACALREVRAALPTSYRGSGGGLVRRPDRHRCL